MIKRSRLIMQHPLLCMHYAHIADTHTHARRVNTNINTFASTYVEQIVYSIAWASFKMNQPLPCIRSVNRMTSSGHTDYLSFTIRLYLPPSVSLRCHQLPIIFVVWIIRCCSGSIIERSHKHSNTCSSFLRISGCTNSISSYLISCMIVW